MRVTELTTDTADTIEYTVRVSSRAKRLQVRINPLCEVEVILPHRMSPRHVAPFVDQNRGWINETRTRLMAERGKTLEGGRGLPDMITLTAVAQRYHVRFQVDQACRLRQVHAPGEEAVLHLTASDEHRACRKLQDWLSGQARQYLPPWLHEVSRELGISYGKVTIRAQKTRWGSCSSKGGISLNRALLFLDPELVRYLMIHELCHRVHMNHSARYWRLVEQFEPACRDYERRLTRAARVIPLWSLRKIAP